MAGSRGPKPLPNGGKAQRGSPGIEGLIWTEEGSWQHRPCSGRRQVWGPRPSLELWAAVDLGVTVPRLSCIWLDHFSGQP